MKLSHRKETRLFLGLYDLHEQTRPLRRGVRSRALGRALAPAMAILLSLVLGACASDGDDGKLVVEPPFPPPVDTKPDKPKPSEPKPGKPPDPPVDDPKGPTPECPKMSALEGSELPIWDLYIEREDWDALHEDVNANVRVHALLCIEDKAHPITVELQGASTRGLPKKSFDVKLRRGVPLTDPVFGEPETRTRVLLKAMFQDQSLSREAIAFDMWRELGQRAPRVSHRNLRINGAYWGLYTLIEPVDEDYLAYHGYEAGGRLYKGVRKHGSRADFHPSRELTAAFENKTDDPQHARWDDLEALVDALQYTPTTREAFERDIEPIFPLDVYLDRLIWVSLTQNSDAVAQNFFLYNTAEDGHDFWQLVPWDSNIAFGADWADPYNLIGPEKQLLLDGGNNYFSKRLLRIAHYAHRYVERYRRVLDEVLTEAVVLGTHQRYRARVENDLALDQARWQRKISPARAFDEIEDFLVQRPAFIDEALDEFESSLPPLEEESEDEPADSVEDGVGDEA